MINIAKECFKALLIELKDGSTLSMSNSDKDRAQNILHLHKHLDYSQSSFMNLFNYKYGHLAPHRDRCLVTVVYTHSRSSTQLLQSHQPENTDTDESTDMNASHETSDNNYNYKHSKKNLWCLAPEHEDHPSNIHHWTSIDTLVAIPANQHSVCLHVGEELRGASQLMYVEAYDAYLVLMSVYSNSTSNEEVEFILWDASEGKLHAHLEVNGDTLISFNEGAIVGSFSELVNFHAYNKLIQEIPMTAGWNWVSFNLDAEEDLLVDKLDIETVTSELAGSDVLIFKYQTEYAQYNSNDNNWYGGLLKLPVNHMYKLQLTQADTIAYEGIILEPESVPIELVQGWNWISYLGQRVLEINQALSSLNPTVGDIIKSRTGFSMYASESLGWLGTLTNMNSGIGYMMYQSSEDISTLIYPNSSMYLASRLSVDKNQYTDDYWNVNTGKFEHSMNIVARIDHPDYNKPHR